MYCNNCGFAIPATAGSCVGCGSPIDARTAPTPAYQVAAPAAQSGFGPPPAMPPAPNYGSPAMPPAPNYGSPAMPPAPSYGGPGQYATPYPGAPAAGHGPATATHWLLPVGRSWQSIVAGYLGLFAIILWPLGPFALGLGVWALVRAAREKAHGTGRAVFAVIVGLVTTFLLIAMVLTL